MYYHSQNVKKEDKENSLVHWRCWIGEKTQLTFCITIPSSFWHIDLDLCQNGWQEEAIGFSIACPLFAIWLGFENRRLYRTLEKITKRKGEKFTNGRNIGISFHNKTLWVNFWRDEMESRCDDPIWWKFNIDFEQLFIGRSKCEKEVLEERSVLVPMPEKSYKANAKLMQYTWKYPRWFTKRIKRVEIELEEPIPHEGKGENSWDCGIDGTHGITTGECNSIAKGVGILVGSCLHDRVRYGGYGDWDWKKENK